MKAFILDTSAFIQGFNTSDPDAKLYTTPLVINEINEEIAKIRVVNWSQTGKLVIITPSSSSIEHVLSQAKIIGEIKSLSTTDLNVVAISHQLKQKGLTTFLISDDYSVQNLADYMGLTYRGMITHGIKRRFHWINYCPGCRKQFDKTQQINICPICGTELKRKPDKKSRTRVEE